jgi:hypothetical protein
VDGAGHGIFNGKRIETSTLSTPSGIKFYSTTGALPEVADKVFQDVLNMLR